METATAPDTDSPEPVGDFVYLSPEVMATLADAPPEPPVFEFIEPEISEQPELPRRHRTRNALIATGGAVLFAAGLGFGAQRARRPAY
jgi:hypothetical protein